MVAAKIISFTSAGGQKILIGCKSLQQLHYSHFIHLQCKVPVTKVLPYRFQCVWSATNPFKVTKKKKCDVGTY